MKNELFEKAELIKDVMNIKEAVKFIVEKSGSIYYENLLNSEDFNKEEEIEDIRELFGIWLEEFDWTEEEKNFMRNF